MDNQMILQMMQTIMPPAFREAAELQQLILAHAEQAGRSGTDGHPEGYWQIGMLEALRAKLPEHNRHMADVLIKCMELAQLLEKGRTQHGHREAL